MFTTTRWNAAVDEQAMQIPGARLVITDTQWGLSQCADDVGPQGNLDMQQGIELPSLSLLTQLLQPSPT